MILTNQILPYESAVLQQMNDPFVRKMIDVETTNHGILKNKN
jgi:hypothetical protein